MRLFTIKNRIVSAGIDTNIQGQVYLFPAVIYESYYRHVSVNFLRIELWFKIINTSNKPF